MVWGSAWSELLAAWSQWRAECGEGAVAWQGLQRREVAESPGTCIPYVALFQLDCNCFIILVFYFY